MPVADLDGIVAFVETARAGSFTAAADRLGLTKSAVGKSVARLEARLGTKLLHRTTRKLSLTADGEAYLARCSLALDGIAEAEAAIASVQGEPRGRLRIDMPAAYGRRILLPVLLDLAGANARLRLSLTFNDRLIDPVEEGVDLVVRLGALKDSAGLVSRLLTRQMLHLCAAPSYLARRGHPETVAALHDHACILGLRSGVPQQWEFQGSDGTPVRLAMSPAHEIGDGDGIIAAALGGLGICQMPASLVADHVLQGTLALVLPQVSTVLVDVHAVWPGARHLSPKVRFLVDSLVAAARAGRLG